jgi:hypothetical protein
MAIELLPENKALMLRDSDMVQAVGIPDVAALLK